MEDQGICVNIGDAWMYLKKVRFHKLDENRYDRKGGICTLFFESFPNREYHHYMMTFAVRAVTALINPSHVLMDLKYYDHSEMNACWVYYNHCYNEERAECHENKWIPVKVDHKYWGELEIETFRAIIVSLATRYKAIIEWPKEPCTRMGGCLLEIGLDHCCCQTGDCD